MKSNEVKDNMRSLFRNGKTWVLITALAGIALGLFMIIKPDVFETIVYYVMGTLLVGFGLVSLVQVFRTGGESLRFGGMIPGVLALAVGLAFFFKQEDIATILWFFVGIVVLVDAVAKLEHAFTMKVSRVKFWWVSLLMAILTMIFAVVIMICDGAQIIIYLAGAFVLANGLIDLAEFVLLVVAGNMLKNVSAAVVIEEVEVKDAPVNLGAASSAEEKPGREG